MEKVFKDRETGEVISTVNQLTPQIEVETVKHGKSVAEILRIYLDGDCALTPYGPDRPCIRIEFAADGKTVKRINLYNDPQGADFEWQR
jgi:hypothetical protein